MQWPGKALETLPDMRRLPAFVGVMSASGTTQGSVFLGALLSTGIAQHNSRQAPQHTVGMCLQPANERLRRGQTRT